MITRLRRLLGRRSARADEGAFVVEGPTLLAEALDAGAEVQEVFVEVGAPAPLLDLAERASAAGARRRVLQDGVVARVATTQTPPPILAVVADPAVPIHVVAAGATTAKAPLVVLASLGDPGNLGTIVRSAAAAGAAGVVAAGGVDPTNPKAVRASAGALLRIPLAVVSEDAAPTVTALAAAGLPLVGATVSGGKAPDEVDLAGAFAVVVGNEAHGLDEGWTSRLDDCVTIPMASAVESVNVAMATTVVLFEAARQRSWSGTDRGGPGRGVG